MTTDREFVRLRSRVEILERRVAELTASLGLIVAASDEYDRRLRAITHATGVPVPVEDER